MAIYLSHFWVLVAVVAVSLPVYWLALRRDWQRRAFVAGLSVAVLLAIEPAFTAVALGLVLITHQLVAAYRDARLSGRRAVLLIVLVALVTLTIGKYGQSMTAALWGHDWLWSRLVMPLGVSYFIFRLMQYVFDHVRGVLQDNSLLDLIAFVLFLPTFAAGPIETYQGFYGKRAGAFDSGLLGFGLRRIAVGYFKKLFVEGFVLTIYIRPYAAHPLQPGWRFSTAHPLQAAFFVCYYFVYAYVDLSSYTDLAIGFAALFGFRIMENFHYPFWSRNLAEFWRRWHISLSSWCRNNVYFPVFGATRKVWLGLFASMLAMGLWHYVGLNWTAWALWHGSGLVVVSWWLGYKRKRRKATKRRPGPLQETLRAPLGYIGTFCFVALGYSFVGTPNIGRAFAVLWAAAAGPFVWLAELGSRGLVGLGVAVIVVMVAVTIAARPRRAAVAR